jgi:hypothetical protein
MAHEAGFAEIELYGDPEGVADEEDVAARRQLLRWPRERPLLGP